MPVLPNVLERFLARRGKIPPLLLDGPVPLFQIGVMIAAMELEVFERLDEGPKELAGLARETGASERGLQNLLDALVPLGYVEEDGGTYRLTPVAADRLPIGDLATMAPFFRAQAELHLEATRGSGKRPRTASSVGSRSARARWGAATRRPCAGSAR